MPKFTLTVSEEELQSYHWCASGDDLTTSNWARRILNRIVERVRQGDARSTPPALQLNLPVSTMPPVAGQASSGGWHCQRGYCAREKDPKAACERGQCARGYPGL